MKRLFITTILVFAVSSLALSPRQAAQDTKPAATPNFTGTWKLNIEKSNFGPAPAPDSRVDKVEHKEPALHVDSTRVQQGVEDKISLSLTTDGKENSNTVNGAELKSKLKWEGAALLIDSAANVEGKAISLKDKWTLSPDGKTLTIARHYTGPEGEADFTYVLDKQ